MIKQILSNLTCRILCQSFVSIVETVSKSSASIDIESRACSVPHLPGGGRSA